MDKVVYGIEHVHLFSCKMQRNSRGVVVVTRGYVVSKSLYIWELLDFVHISVIKTRPPENPDSGVFPWSP